MLVLSHSLITNDPVMYYRTKFWILKKKYPQSPLDFQIHKGNRNREWRKVTSKLHHRTYILIFHLIPSALWLWNNLACRSHPETLLLLGKKLLALQEHLCTVPSKTPLKPQIPSASAEAQCSMDSSFLRNVSPLLYLWFTILQDSHFDYFHFAVSSKLYCICIKILQDQP